jgi:FkbM family methyltransferase
MTANPAYIPPMNLGEDLLKNNRQRSLKLLDRFAFALRLRPAALGSMIIKFFGPEDRRLIISTSSGLQIYADPFTYLGGELNQTQAFEPDTEELIRSNLSAGGVFLDVGANEGYFSALAGTVVGPSGFVVAIEPQSRLQNIIALNLLLNGVKRSRVYMNALGGMDGEEGQMNLWPSLNTGASSLMHKYRFSRNSEAVRFVSPERILSECALDHVDLVKIDVEGFEGEVIRSLRPLLSAHRVKAVLVDYHRQILDRAGVDPQPIDEQILTCGYVRKAGPAVKLESYQLYLRR